MRLLYDDGLRGRVVIDAEGRALGDVADLLIDPSTWTIKALRVKVRRALADVVGAPHGLFRAPYVEVPVDVIGGVGDTVVLRVRSAALRAAATPAPAQVALDAAKPRPT